MQTQMTRLTYYKDRSSVPNAGNLKTFEKSRNAWGLLSLRLRNYPRLGLVKRRDTFWLRTFSILVNDEGTQRWIRVSPPEYTAISRSVHSPFLPSDLLKHLNPNWAKYRSIFNSEVEVFAAEILQTYRVLYGVLSKHIFYPNVRSTIWLLYSKIRGILFIFFYLLFLKLAFYIIVRREGYITTWP